MIGANCTQKTPLWQALEYRKRCLVELERRHFSVNHDYDTIFNQIHKELHDEYPTPKTDPDFKAAQNATGEQESEFRKRVHNDTE